MNPRCMKEAIKEAKKSNDSDGYFVGAVIVKNKKIISKAHSNENEDNSHAEELAIKKCKEDLFETEMYLTMEPCDFRSSERKSCCEMIINSGIKKIFYGVLDPREECKGIEKLNLAGVEVIHFTEFEDECKKITPNLIF